MFECTLCVLLFEYGAPVYTIFVYYSNANKCTHLPFHTGHISFVFTYFYKMLHTSFHQFVNNLYILRKYFVDIQILYSYIKNKSKVNSLSTPYNGLVVKMLDSQSRGPVFKTTGWLQGRLSLSSFRGR